ncbi:ATP-dependent helicase [Acidithiobacillus thiooxidans]|uniref:UvrD-helicase domain-containing protein n=1 Tax=Acidithiobacillus thiooxidans TaxID=930 RepID=UPI001C07560D|nr:UvrD-helicase domain-containing protein [Acidithiobacillus thiooxidans]MBU2750518.1 ATP-dependent helicase [Acidithiobacillus thiooxidans]
MEPNAEQSAILQAIYERHPYIAVNALAGTGKSTTVRFAVEGPLQGRNTQYLVFNKKNADEAKARLPGNVRVNTAHSLAWNGPHPDGGSIRSVYGGRRVDRLYGELKNSHDPRFTSYLRSMQDVGLSRAQAIFLVQGVLSSFCQSTHERAERCHIAPDLAAQIRLRLERRGAEAFLNPTLEAAVGVSNHLFADMRDPQGRTPVTHDAYLKIWSMGHPVIPADHILFDEAQDASMPMMQGVLKQQHAQLVFIGDTHQSIYGWRGAVDAMQALKEMYPETRVLPLQSSYRFGQAIADAGNVFLTALYEREQTPPEFRAFLKGVGPYDSRMILGGDHFPDMRKATAYLFRSNAPLVQSALQGLQRGDKVYMAGDQAKEIAAFIEACAKLYFGQFTPHPDLRFFDHFNELEKFTETREGQGLRFLTQLVKKNHGNVSQEVQLLNRIPLQQGVPDYTLSTMHRSKGLEFAHVALDVGAQKPFEVDEETGEKPSFENIPSEVFRVLYVAVTRAHESLHDQGLFRAFVHQVDHLPQAVHAAVSRLDQYRLQAKPRAIWETRQYPPVPDPAMVAVPIGPDWTPDWVHGFQPERAAACKAFQPERPAAGKACSQQGFPPVTQETTRRMESSPAAPGG